MDDTEHFTSDPDGVNVAWKGVQELWEKQLLCDVKLVAQGQVFQVHRVYLASCSGYFHSLFTQGYKESTKGEVSIHGVTAAALDAIIRYLYTGSIDINQNNIIDILHAGSMLQIDDVQTFCCRYLKSHVESDNCIEYLQVAELYSLVETARHIWEYMLKNFGSFSSTDIFLKCDHDMLCQLLASDSLEVDSEMTLFDSIVRWLAYDSGRLLCARKLLKLIRYGLMNLKEIRQIKSHEIFLQADCGDEIQKLLQEATDYHHNIYEQPLVESPLVRPRAYWNSLVVIQENRDRDEDLVVGASRVVMKELSEFCRVGQKSPFQNISLFSACASATLNNCVFVAGGMIDTTEVDTAFRYNGSTGEWLQLANMNGSHCDFALVALSDCLFAVGGAGGFDTEAEKYSLRENSWARLPSVDWSVYANAGCACSGLVYISGGVYGDTDPDVNNASARVQCFDPDLNSWTQKSPMNIGRMSHAMVAVREKIFVCGGESGMLEGGPNILTSEVYDFKTDQWSTVAPMPFSSFHSGAACYIDSVYIVGGEGEMEDLPHGILMRFDMDLNEWSVQRTQLKNIMWGVAGFLKISTQTYIK